MAITLDGVWKDKVCGMCGDFDQNPANDLADRLGNLFTSPIAFGKYWLSDKVDENNHPEGKACSSVNEPPKCLEKNRRLAEYVCLPLQGRGSTQLFNKCVPGIPTTVKNMMYETCVYDYCITAQ